ncbi:MAG: kelch repeat-containing protein [Candidatus Binataceae bacterium]
MRQRWLGIAIAVLLLVLPNRGLFAQTGSEPDAKPPPVKLVTAPLQFGQVHVFFNLTKNATLTNSGKQSFSIASVTVSPSPEFTTPNGCVDKFGFPVSSVDPGQSCFIPITFQPGRAGQRNGTLLITVSSLTRPRRVALRGRGFGTVISAVGDVLITQGQSTALYEPATNTFAPPGTGPNLNTTDGLTATRLQNSKVLMAVGQPQLPPGGPLVFGAATTELYDPTNNSFAPPALTATMQETIAFGAVAVSLLDGRALIAGGFDGPCFTTGSAELYDPTTNSFATPIGMNSARGYPTANLIHDGPNAGKVLIAGGDGPWQFDCSVPPVASTDLYDPATDSFAPPTATATMNTARASAAAVELNNGKILIVGGTFYTPGLDAGASTELYDEATNSFEPATVTPSMNTKRQDASAILLNTGKVLVVGGIGTDGNPLASTELYDPVTNTFAPPEQTPTLKVAGAFDTLTALDDGRILVTDPDTTTELYDPVANVFTLGPASPLSGANTATLLE